MEQNIFQQNWTSKHRNKNYNLLTIPKTDNYDELCFILSHGLEGNIYKKLPSQYCGDKANILLAKWGYNNINYEIY